MPVYKYKDFNSAEEALWARKVDSSYLKRLDELFKLKNYLHHIDNPKGIYKFKTLEEINRFDEKIIIKNALKSKGIKASANKHKVGKGKE